MISLKVSRRVVRDERVKNGCTLILAGSYIYAGGTTVSLQDTYILSTKLPFEIKEPSRLDFFVYQAGVKGRLQVCINTIGNCALNIKGGTIDIKARRWKNYYVPITSSAHVTFCNYVTSATTHGADISNGTLKDWTISSKAVLNSLTGIPHDLSKTGSYIYAGGTTVSLQDTYILSTKIPFEIKEPSRLDFFVYQAGVKGRLQVCINTIGNCALNIKGGTIDIKARRWKNYYVPITSSAHVIHFVADGLQDNYAIGLDHIQLLNKYGMASQQCK
ncbi:hypothetical protein OESDEN_05194 [Oesophagostomum dentatum]|uniref:Uncharacterized protein n=1 Tax=Oesophagostomum dentatum TaxID=61180 RepID=A0A0B1TBB9_OESDE|nr:hypothetical protein OESDEN_05194 [Oesophagostomum dentatum]